MAPAMKPMTRARKTTSFTWYGDSPASLRTPLSKWPDMESNGSSADDVSDFPDIDDQKGNYRSTPAARASCESEMSDAGDCDDRRRFRDSSVKVSYDSDSCLTPRSRRTLRRSVSGITEPWPSVTIPAKPKLDTIFSPTHEILHPLQSLRMERSFSNISNAGRNVDLGRSNRVSRTSVTFESFTLPNPEANVPEFDGYVKRARSPQPKASEFDGYVKPALKPQLESTELETYTNPSPQLGFTPLKFESYAFPDTKRSTIELERYASLKPQLDCVDFESYRFPKPQLPVRSSLEDEKLEQKQSLIRRNGVDDAPLKVKEERNPETALARNVVVIIVDAEKKLTFVALDWAINVAVRPGDEIVVLGVLKHILSPLGYKMVADTDPLYGVNREVLQLEVNKTTAAFESKLRDSGRGEECEKKKVKLTVRIAPGARVRTVVVRELGALGATYAIFDRKAMRSRRYYGKHLSCHAVRMRKNGRSTKTITLLPQKAPTKARSPTSDISSISSMSTDRTSSESPSLTLWRRITSFRSSRRSRTASPGSSPGSHRSDTTSPSAVTPNDPDAFMPEAQDLDTLSTKLKLFRLAEAPKACVSADGYSYKGMESHRKNLPAMSVTVPPPICAARDGARLFPPWTSFGNSNGNVGRFLQEIIMR